MKEFILTQEETERTVLVGLITNTQNEAKANEYLDELAFLAETAGSVAREEIPSTAQHPQLPHFRRVGKTVRNKSIHRRKRNRHGHLR